MAKLYDYELGKATDIVIRDWLEVKPGEVVVITTATEIDERVPESFARSAYAVGGKPMVIYTATPKGVGKAADPYLPIEAIGAAIQRADVWLEINDAYLLYSTAYEMALENKKLRHLAVGGLDTSMVYRLIENVDAPALRPFWERITDMSRFSKHMRITTPAGTDIEFGNRPDYPFSCDTGKYNVPGHHFMLGQIS